MADKNVNNPVPDNTTVIDISGGKKGVAKKKPKKEKKKREKKKSKFFLFIIVVVLILLIAAFLTAHFYFDFFKWKAPMFSLMHHLDPYFVELVDLESTLAGKEAALEELKANLNERENSLNMREAQLQKREDELLQIEKARIPVYRPPINDSDREYMENIAKIYAGMEPENAANVMVNLYSIEDMAAVIYFMSTSKAADILECMNAELAAEITDQLLNTYS